MKILLNNKVIQNVIDDLKLITKTDLCISDINGNICATTFDDNNVLKNYIIDFFNSMAEMQVVDGYNFFKVLKKTNICYIVIVKGISEDCYKIGKICVSQLKNLIIAYEEKYDKNSFIQNLIFNNILLADIYNQAKDFGIENNANRVVIIIETDCEKDSSSLEMIKNIFGEDSKDFILSINEKDIIILKDLGENATYESVANISNILLDMFNTEIMVKAKVSYGTIVSDLKNVSRSYNKAKMSMEIGNIFYNEKNIIGYDNLGIGRLLYQLPINTCKIFMKEVFKEEIPDTLDKETLITIYKFFENNLNISETSRNLYIHRNTLVYRLEKLQKLTGIDIKNFDDALTFKIALLLINYIRYIENKNN